MLVEAASECVDLEGSYILREKRSPFPILPKTHYPVIWKKKRPELLVFIFFYLNRDPNVNRLGSHISGIPTQTPSTLL